MKGTLLSLVRVLVLSVCIVSPPPLSLLSQPLPFLWPQSPGEGTRSPGPARAGGRAVPPHPVRRPVDPPASASRSAVSSPPHFYARSLVSGLGCSTHSPPALGWLCAPKQDASLPAMDLVCTPALLPLHGNSPGTFPAGDGKGGMGSGPQQGPLEVPGEGSASSCLPIPAEAPGVLIFPGENRGRKGSWASTCSLTPGDFLIRRRRGRRRESQLLEAFSGGSSGGENQSSVFRSFV